MKKQIVAGTSASVGAGLTGWAIYNAMQLASGAFPMTPVNTAMTSAMASAGVAGLSLSAIVVWARHWALLVLAAISLDDPEDMAMIQKMAAKQGGSKPPTVKALHERVKQLEATPTP